MGADDQGWRAKALCADMDPDEQDVVFFPPHHSDAIDAKRICIECPVAEACLRFALETRQEFGVWGGETERERKQAEAARKYPHRPNAPTDDDRCGTYAGTKAHIKRREQFCRPCKDAKAAYERDRKARARMNQEGMSA